MAAIRSKDTKPELALRAALREVGATGYRLHRRDIPGRPDVAYMRWQVAVFVDGVFWHGHPDHFNPRTASEYWRTKIARTQARDRAADKQLLEDGWIVVRVWDLDVIASPDAVVTQVIDALRAHGWPGPGAAHLGARSSVDRTLPGAPRPNTFV